MARIRTVHSRDRPLIVITGRLTSADVGRLEQACAPALTVQSLCLEIDLRGVTYTDSTAAAMLRRLVARGAVLTSPANHVY